MNAEFKIVYMSLITIIWIYCIMVVFKTTLWQLVATIVAFILLVPAIRRGRQK